MNNKHAYLIMAHHRMDLLQMLIDELDDELNDLYIHIDKKYKESLNLTTSKSKLFFIERMDVRWAGYTQIECEIALIKAALKSKINYSYLHIMTGATFPIKSKEYIFEFFKKNNGKEFIGFDSNQDNYYDRVKNHFLFSEVGKPTNIYKRLLIYIRYKLVNIENLLGIDHFKKFGLVFKKGLAYCSITPKCAQYIVDNEKIIKKMCKKSISGDEVFVQTIVYNSSFVDNIYDLENEYNGCLTSVAWPCFCGEDRWGNNFLLKDYEIIKNSKALFALKFEGPEGIDLINRIKETNKSKQL